MPIRIFIYQNCSIAQPTTTPIVNIERFRMNTHMQKSEYLPTMFTAKIDSLSLKFMPIRIHPYDMTYNIYADMNSLFGKIYLIRGTMYA